MVTATFIKPNVKKKNIIADKKLYTLSLILYVKTEISIHIYVYLLVKLMFDLCVSLQERIFAFNHTAGVSWVILLIVTIDL